MSQGAGLIVYPVKDLDKAKAIFTTLLGTEPYVDSPYYVGYRTGDQEIGLDPNGHASGLTGPRPYWSCDDFEATVKDLVNVGATLRQEPTDVGGGMIIAVLEDADGNVIGLNSKR